MRHRRHRATKWLIFQGFTRKPNATNSYAKYFSQGLKTACGEDRELLEEVESLLIFEDSADTFIEEPLWRLDVGTLEPLPRQEEEGEEENLGRSIGPYRLEHLQAAGGMGRVYIARREDDYEQVVALKLIRSGLHAASEIMTRFFTERQILAQLQHPHISQLLDGGTTDEGEPYLVMEFVDGVPIDDYCRQQNLSIPARLRLFRQVCSAVHFAHQNLVVHRDLKPGNILVTPDGIPKLLDFGIAKILQERGQASRLHTMPGRGLMTPNYASPEQVREEAITTASDIYSLGVLLYLLLSGRLPYELQDSGYSSMVEVVCHTEPRRPSTAIQGLPTAVESKPRPGRSLSRQLRGDLDAIVLKAMRKEPQHRYSSAEQLAEDLRRHLEGLPVLARQGTWAYLAGKFLRRHRLGLSILVGILALILGFTFALKGQLDKTERERQRTRQVVDFLIMDVFGAADPNRSRGEEITARELLDKGAERIHERLEDEPAVRATLLMTLGRIYRNLDHQEEAQQLLEEAYRLRRQLFDESSPELANGINVLATILHDQGRYREAEDLLRDALAMRRELFGDVDGDVARTLNGLGAVLDKQGKSDEAEAAYQEALAIRRKIYGSDHIEVSNSLNNLGSFLFNHESAAEAEPLFREALRIREATYGRDHTAVATAYNNLGRVLFAQGKLNESEAFYQQALAIREKLVGADSSSVAGVQRQLALVRAAQKRPRECETLAETALVTFRRTLPEGHWLIGDTESILGSCLLLTQRFEEAEVLLLQGYETLRSALGEDDTYTRDALDRLEQLHTALGR